MKDKTITFLEGEVEKKEKEFWEVAHNGDPRVWGRQGARDEALYILTKVREIYESEKAEYNKHVSIRNKL